MEEQGEITQVPEEPVRRSSRKRKSLSNAEPEEEVESERAGEASKVASRPRKTSKPQTDDDDSDAFPIRGLVEACGSVPHTRRHQRP